MRIACHPQYLRRVAMKPDTLPYAFLDCRTRRQARRLAPWAMIVSKVAGGWMAFKDGDAYVAWKYKS